MQVEELMTKDVFCVSGDQSVNDAAHLMWEKNCGCVPIVDSDNRVTGMVTDRDIAMAAYFEGKPLAEIPLSKTQTRPLVSCTSTDELKAVEQLMQSHQVHRVPVVDESMRPVGLVSLNDIAVAYKAGNKEVKAKELCDTLSAICATNGGGPVQAMA